MAVYVDNTCTPWRGKQWCHMLADSLAELHQFAVLLGLSRGLFHRNASYPHYDVTVKMRDIAIRHGALLSDRATIIGCAKRLKNELSYGVQQSTQLIGRRQTIPLRGQTDFFPPAELNQALGSFTPQSSCHQLVEKLELAADA
jgi:Protein of unknown function (DUF4031)